MTQRRPRQVGGPAYDAFDPDGLHLGTFVERPLTIGGHPGERAATLDLYDATGAEVLRLTRDPHLVASACAAAGWGALAPWGYLVLGPDLAPVAWVQAPGGTELAMAKATWQVHCVGAPAPIEIRGHGPTTRRGAPRPVTMAGTVVGQILLVSGSRQPDSYVLDLHHGPPMGGLATTLVALVPLYDQIFRTVSSPVRAAGGTFDPSWGSSF